MDNEGSEGRKKSDRKGKDGKKIDNKWERGEKGRQNDLGKENRDGVPASSTDHIQHICLNAV